MFICCVLHAERGCSSDSPTAHREDLGNLSTSNVHTMRFKNPEVTLEGNASLPSADESLKPMDLLRSCRSKQSAKGNVEADKEATYERTIIEQANGDGYWRRSGDFSYRHHEVLQLKLYVPTEETFPTPMKYVDVLRQTRTSIHSAAPHTMRDCGMWRLMPR